MAELRNDAIKLLKGGPDGWITKIIRDKITGRSNVKVGLGKPHDAWWMIPKIIESSVKHAYKHEHGGNTDFPKYMNTFMKLSIRKPYGANEYQKNGRYWTNHITFDYSVLTKDEDRIPQNVRTIVKWTFNVMRSFAAHSGGQYSLDIIERAAEIEGEGNTRGLYNSLVTGTTNESVVSKMNKQIVNCFKNDIELENGVHFDKYCTDFEIKHFLEHRLGINKWEDVPSASRKALYKDNWKKSQLPSWGNIEKLRYN